MPPPARYCRCCCRDAPLLLLAPATVRRWLPYCRCCAAAASPRLAPASFRARLRSSAAYCSPSCLRPPPSPPRGAWPLPPSATAALSTNRAALLRPPEPGCALAPSPAAPRRPVRLALVTRSARRPFHAGAQESEATFDESYYTKGAYYYVQAPADVQE
nr:uncharacterized protein LOC109740773 [Aegilops tauschii subsp. strangulata]